MSVSLPLPLLSLLPLLLVDDEEGIRTVLALLLADMGCAVRTAASGAEALAMVRADPPAVVLTDVRMPGMDGMDLLRAVKAEFPAVEVLVLTGHGDMELAVSSLRFGAGDFLTKPVAPEALEVALDRARQRMALREALRRHTEELEQLVAQRTRELLHAERLAAVGETAAGLAHAIKNVAGGLEGAMFVLEKGLELDRRDYLEQGWRMVRDDVARVRDLAMRLLDMGRAAELAPRPCDPDGPLRDVVRLLVPRAAAAGVALVVQAGAGPEPAMLDPDAVHRCLMDLVVNAIEAFEDDGGTGALAGGPASAPTTVAARMDAGGPEAGGGDPDASRRVVLRSRRVVLPEPAGAEGAPGGELGSVSATGIEYVVEDNGPGFPEQARQSGQAGQEQGSNAAPDGFAAFVSAKPGGSGVGLMATRKLAREMGGELELGPALQGHGVRAVLRVRVG
ncbi:response regulator [Nitratidesulfovibrio sp. SRB-5]|uniref:response regulator n=1 Tax=Nitratidesulfovibrio sp. SRB-5 TaxID=2872636 RepID=UPI0010273141|nr:response regulator [Nitratidesulfovibrio sp. SRB-5]MBZ2170725.1 response regulator [Nitratidesulfovibrio sp. SRB-5]RXF77693.1 response regulator [Desulfovibrio sp. DS-1]